MKIDSNSTFFILTDLEGVAGVTFFSQTREQGPKKQAAMVLLTGEVNAAIKAIKMARPSAEIHVWDGHGSGGIIKDELDPDAIYLPNGRVHMVNYFRERDINALLFVGQHAMSYTLDGNLCHTMSSRNVEYYMLNGRLIGEFGLRAAIAGEIGVPTIYLSGDEKACQEAANAVPGIVTTPVKVGTGWESADCLSPTDARTAISRDVQEAIGKIAQIKPFTVERPVCLEITARSWVNVGGYLGMGAARKGLKTVLFEVGSMEALVDTGIL